MHPFHFALLPAGHISNDLAIKLINVGQNESNGHIYIKPLLFSKLSQTKSLRPKFYNHLYEEVSDQLIAVDQI